MDEQRHEKARLLISCASSSVGHLASQSQEHSPLFVFVVLRHPLSALRFAHVMEQHPLQALQMVVGHFPRVPQSR